MEIQDTQENSLEASLENSEVEMQTQGKLTPLMLQYWEVKSAHPDKVVLFRMGDFFEMFHQDAITAAPVLGIALTSRNKKSADDTKMCGVPHHSIGPQINKLLAAGFKVAICDQLEDPKFAKGIVKRGVTRILSPGMVYDSDTLDAFRPNYLASIDAQGNLAFFDSTTGEAFYYLKPLPEQRSRLLSVLQPVEIVIAPRTSSETSADGKFAGLEKFNSLITEFSLEQSASSGQAEKIEACARLKAYAQFMQGSSGEVLIGEFALRETLSYMHLSATVMRHLEIFETYKGEKHGTLFHTLNRCQTSSGARLLRQWLTFPLASTGAITRRQDAVAFYHQNLDLNSRLRKTLSGLGDIERRLGKIGTPNCHPRDLLALAESLQAGTQASLLGRHKEWNEIELQMAEKLADEILRTLRMDPPAQIKAGQIINRGVQPNLDELFELSENSQKLIMDLEAREREATGISSLKVRFNNVFGYYIEITNTHKDKVPKDRYERKQTLANAERYLTKELEEIERKVLSSQVRRVELELEIFEDLKREVLANARRLMVLATEWSELDVYSALAWLAVEQRYCRPDVGRSDVGSGTSLNLLGSRHPVIEQILKKPFVANDIQVRQGQCMLLTGPNMAGKSTLMRQVALTAILAQVGSFVPAKSAALPVYDRIFTRIGASDFLNEGLSTFMVEMQETAEMLNSAGSQSLVILDEVGRGTSTFDGLSLAQAILEHLLQTTGSTTLFATHYHELTALAETFSGLMNAHMQISENNGDVIFLHQLVKGSAKQSYGIHVAKLAGIPKPVLKRAQSVLKNLESSRPQLSSQLDLLSILEDASFEESVDVSGLSLERESSLDRESNSNREELEKLRGLEQMLMSAQPEQMTPMQALSLVAQWQQAFREKQ